MGVRSFVSIAKELLGTPILFKNPLSGQTCHISAQEAIVLKCIDDAKKGNYFALKILIELVETSDRYHEAMRGGSEEEAREKKDEYTRKLMQFKNVTSNIDNR